jgi:hypothetical protein
LKQDGSPDQRSLLSSGPANARGLRAFKAKAVLKAANWNKSSAELGWRSRSTRNGTVRVRSW